jgi:hypothetical protein
LEGGIGLEVFWCLVGLSENFLGVFGFALSGELDWLFLVIGQSGLFKG